MDPTTLQQINDILGNSSSNGQSAGGGLFDINAILEPLMPFIIGLTIVSVIITILYIMNVITAWRSQRAIIDMHRILKEMNERDKARSIVSTIEAPSQSSVD
ncbi:MAG: hypothetical protein KA604_00450 [Candidatus Saccharimonas sp.]|nr:hypothetical protein [Candidatus Saccharimonas sp.]